MRGKTPSVNFVSSVTSEVQIGGENDVLENQLKRAWELESISVIGVKCDYRSKKIIH